jgi:BolA protein
MDSAAKGPVAAEIEKRLVAALAPQTLAVIDDSEKHRGHAGHDGRVARQRMVNHALAELLEDRVHALAIRAQAPSEVA